MAKSLLRFEIAAFLLLLMPWCASAQQYAFQTDSANDGLASLTITAIQQDAAGRLWVGTENGLYRSDGATYTRIGPPDGLRDSYVVALAADAAGGLWVGTVNNLYHGDGRHFSTVAADPHGLTVNSGQQIAAMDGGRALAVSNQRLYQVTPSDGQWRASPFFSAADLARHPEFSAVNGIYAIPGGSLWFGCKPAICQWSNGELRVWREKDGVPQDTWVWFLQDSAGRLWARGMHHIRALLPSQSEFVDEDIPGVPISNTSPLLPLIEDRAGRIVTRTGHGLASWKGGRWQVMGPANGLTAAGVRALAVDSEGTLWLGTYGQGVQRWVGYGDWETWAASQGLDQGPVWAMLRDSSHRLWMGTEQGIVRFHEPTQNFVPWTPPGVAPPIQVVSVQEDPAHALWFASAGGRIDRYSPQTGRTQSWPVSSYVRKLTIDSTGRAWVLTSHDVYFIDSAPNKGALTRVVDPAVPNQLYYDACEDRKHQLWLGSKSGLLRFAGGVWTAVAPPGPASFDGTATVACAADGSLWIGRDSSGLEHLIVSGNKATDAPVQPPAEFNSVQVMFLRFDRRGWLWVGSGTGVYVFNGQHWRHLTQKDGLTWNDCDEGAFLEDSDGSIWIGTSVGVSRLLHPEKLFDLPTLGVAITYANLGGNSLPLEKTGVLPWTREPLMVRLSSTAIGNQTSILYHYRLHGLEKQWSVSRTPDLRYSALPDGHYQLEVYAEDPDRGIRSPSVLLSFQLRPPWWKRMQFLAAAALVVAGLFWLLLRLRDRRLLARQSELEQLVRERTEELEIEKLQLMEAREALREQATRDPLTGLLNRGGIREVLDREMARAQREQASLTAVLIDLDHFKLVNDAYGHNIGDQVLREVGRRLTDSIRTYDAAGRYGGEEFLIIMPEFDAGQELERLAKVHNAVCSRTVPVPGGELTITCSFGVSVMLAGQSLGAEEFIDRADKALYRAKRAGRNRVEFDLPAAWSEKQG